MNALTETQMLLVQFMEECNEAAQAAAKCLRFTMDDCRGPSFPPNVEGLRAEFVDILGVASRLQDLNILPRMNTEEVTLGVEFKRSKIAQYAAISKKLGTLQTFTPHISNVKAGQ